MARRIARWALPTLGVVAAIIVANSSPIGAALLMFGSLAGLARDELDTLSTCTFAFAALLVPTLEAKIGLIGLVVVHGASRRRALDEPSVGWGLLLAAFVLKKFWSGDILLHFSLFVFGAFLLGGLWPATGSWLRQTEGWGRRVARGVLAVALLSDLIRTFYSVSFEAWAPLLVFLPGIGVLWAAALSLSERGQRASLGLFWFFELQLLAVFALGTRAFGTTALPLLVWSTLLPLGCLLAVTGDSIKTGIGRGSRVLGLAAVASVLLLPGMIGFAANFIAVFRLLASSPAGLAAYGLGLLSAPILLRPVREELRAASSEKESLVAAMGAVVLMVLLGLVPDLLTEGPAGAIIWKYLLANM